MDSEEKNSKQIVDCTFYKFEGKILGGECKDIIREAAAIQSVTNANHGLN